MCWTSWSYYHALNDVKKVTNKVRVPAPAYKCAPLKDDWLMVWTFAIGKRTYSFSRFVWEGGEEIIKTFKTDGREEPFSRQRLEQGDLYDSESESNPIPQERTCKGREGLSML